MKLRIKFFSEAMIMKANTHTSSLIPASGNYIKLKRLNMRQVKDLTIDYDRLPVGHRLNSPQLHPKRFRDETNPMHQAIRINAMTNTIRDMPFDGDVRYAQGL
jgi:hypothetical protein